MATGPIPQDEIPQIRRNGWADNFFRPLLVTIMILSFNISLVNLVRLVNPAWRGTYLLVGILLVTMEAVYSYRVMQSWRLVRGSPFQYRLAEWMVLIVMLKLLSWFGKPAPLMWAELEAIWYDPLNIINVEFYILVCLAILAWSAATNTMVDFERLYDPYSFHARPLDSLITRFFWGGTILVVIAGLSQWLVRAELRSLIDFQRPSLGGILVNVLVYFMAGLVLLSQANLTRLMAGWQYQKIPMTHGLVKQWAKYGLILLGGITAAVFLLPTSYSLGFLASAGLVVQHILQILLFIIQLIIFLIVLPFLWLASFFEPPAEPQRLLPPQMPVLPPAAAATSAPSWLEAVKSLIFWLLVLASMVYFVRIYFSDHPELWRTLKNLKPIGLLANVLRQLWQQLWGLARGGLEMLPKTINLFRQEGSTPAKSGRGSWFGLRRMSPRAQIVRYYLNILQRAEKRGLARKAHQTPHEYEPDLSQATPEVQPEIRALTRAFVQARYSREAISKEQEAAVKRYWRQIRRELKGKGKKNLSEQPDEPAPNHH